MLTWVWLWLKMWPRLSSCLPSSLNNWWGQSIHLFSVFPYLNPEQRIPNQLVSLDCSLWQMVKQVRSLAPQQQDRRLMLEWSTLCTISTWLSPKYISMSLLSTCLWLLILWMTYYHNLLVTGCGGIKWLSRVSHFCHSRISWGEFILFVGPCSMEFPLILVMLFSAQFSTLHSSYFMHSLQSLVEMMGNAIQPLLGSISDALEAIILTMHSEDFAMWVLIPPFYLHVMVCAWVYGLPMQSPSLWWITSWAAVFPIHEGAAAVHCSSTIFLSRTIWVSRFHHGQVMGLATIGAGINSWQCIFCLPLIPASNPLLPAAWISLCAMPVWSDL